MLDSAVNGWKIQNLIDDQRAEKLCRKKVLAVWLSFIGLIPFIGSFFHRITGHKGWRNHYKKVLTSWDYLRRAFRGRIAEKIVVWHRAGRIDGAGSLKTAESGWLFTGHFMLSILPVGLHRFITDWQYAKDRLVHLFVRPIRLYFDSQLREQWLRDMVTEGQKKHILNDEDAKIILSQVDEPYIQKYLKSLAVHICTLPVTQVVSVLVAVIFIAMHPEMSRAQAWGIGVGILALFQVVPISPGSLVRGLYVVYLVIKERSFKDYNIAVFLGFFKYIGYLAFPIQMAYRYPVLARFMAGHWANESVHIVPVFGESGALLEHWMFCLFYNWPLTIRYRIRKRIQLRASIRKRFWHVGMCAVVAAVIFGLADLAYLKNIGKLPDLREIWWLSVLVPMLCGAVVTFGCGGATLGERFFGAVICGAIVGMLYTAVSTILVSGGEISIGTVTTNLLWRIFIFSIFSFIGAVITELKLGDPELK
jgi:hypothetical protein